MDYQYSIRSEKPTTSMKAFPSNRDNNRERAESDFKRDGNSSVLKVVQSDALVAATEVPKNYSIISIIALSVSLMATWEALCSTMGSGLASGGSVSLVYGFIVSLIGNILTSMSLAEAAAMYPSAGGQYQFVAELSPPSIRACASWYCGWLTVLGWHAFTASAPFGAASLTMGLIGLNNPNFVPQPWHVSVLYWAITVIALGFNLYGNKILPFIQNSILGFHIGFFIVIFAVILALSPSKNTAAFVFTEFRNSTGWSQDGIAWCLGMLTSCYVMVGYDSATHLSEEIPNPAVNVPRAMLGSIIANGVMGFAMLILILFSMGDLDAALQSGPFPIIHIFNTITRGNAAAASAMTATIIVSASLATLGLLTTTSRILWAFARDGAPPYSNWLGRLDPKSQVPTISILCSTAIVLLLGILNIASTTAFAAILSLTVVGLNLSYLMPIVLLMYRRLFAPELLDSGPWKMGRLGAIVNFLSISFLVFTSIFLLFPVSQPVTPKNMNYASAVLGGVMFLITGDYIFRARTTYTGPRLILEGVIISSH